MQLQPLVFEDFIGNQETTGAEELGFVQRGRNCDSHGEGAPKH